MDPNDTAQQHIEYTRMIVPASMRSHYWKYFGFPADNSNQILTKQKIVCILCNTAIAYNKNTTNLRTHLVAKHPETLAELTKKKRRMSGDAKTPGLEKRSKIFSIATKQNINLDTTRLTSVDRIASSESFVDGGESVDDGDHEINSDKKKNFKENNWSLETPIKLSIIDSLSTESEEMEQHSVDKMFNPSEFQDYSNNLETTTYALDEIYESSPIKSQQQSTNLDLLIQNMLIKDLLPSSFVNGAGFMKLVYNLGTTTSLNRKYEIEQSIAKLYEEHFEKVSDTLRSITNNAPFSISIEITTNIENKSYLSIYINYLCELDTSLQNVFFKMVELTSNINLGDVFDGINLNKCVAAVINTDNILLENFISEQGIPMFPCFNTVLNRCMQSVFSLPSVNMLYNKIVNIFHQHCYLDEVPDVYEEYAWSKYNFLQFFNDCVTMKDVKDAVIVESKHLCEYLSPLKMTLDTLADEPLSLSSLIRPLISRLLDGHFSASSCESEMIADIKDILNDELSLCLSNEFLIESTFFDPRFQKSIYPDNVELIKRTLTTKYKHIIDDDLDKRNIKEEQMGNVRKKSYLKLFLNRKDSEVGTNSSNCDGNNVHLEISKYVNLAEADLDQCPVSWWKENGLQYKQLNKVSHFYMCVPFHITTLFKKTIPEHMEIMNRRYMLRNNYGNQLWFLHYNMDYLASMP